METSKQSMNKLIRSEFLHPRIVKARPFASTIFCVKHVVWRQTQTPDAPLIGLVLGDADEAFEGIHSVSWTPILIEFLNIHRGLDCLIYWMCLSTVPNVADNAFPSCNTELC